jgi:hypothetical protein
MRVFRIHFQAFRLVVECQELDNRIVLAEQMQNTNRVGN